VTRTLLIRGMAAGLAAGVPAFVFAWIAGEPAVSTAISFEAARLAAEGTPYTITIVPRDIQSTIGLLTAVVVYGVALGGTFSLVFAAVYGRVRQATPRRTSLVLAAMTFAVVSLVPFLKYPANPPAVGRPETIGTRTALYVAMVAISVAAAVYATWLSGRLSPRLGAYGAVLASIGVYIVIVLVGGLLLPPVNEVPATFPAVTLWNFREASIGIQAITWTVIGLVFAGLAERALDRAPAPRPAPARVPAAGS